MEKKRSSGRRSEGLAGGEEERRRERREEKREGSRSKKETEPAGRVARTEPAPAAERVCVVVWNSSPPTLMETMEEVGMDGWDSPAIAGDDVSAIGSRASGFVFRARKR